jgi:phosphoglycerate dehydrogenase-like enzyme
MLDLAGWPSGPHHLFMSAPAKHILITTAVGAAGLQRLRDLPGVELHTVGPFDDAPELPADLLRKQHVLLCKLPPRNLEDMNSLELIQLSTVGYEHLGSLSLADRSFRVCNARGIFDTAIAEWNLSMMINLARDLPTMFRHQQQHVWDRSDRFQEEIRSRVVGLWGYGGIGRETARLAKAFGLTVHVLTRSGVKPRRDTYLLLGTGDPEGRLPDRAFTTGQEAEFLAGLDFLILALPRTQQTTGMVGATELRALPRTAFVLNPARGPIIQEAALLKALRERWIAGAALDTHFAYPLPADHPLWQFPNVILTPHISGADRSRLFPERMADLFLQNVERHLAGRPLFNEISATEWREV